MQECRKSEEVQCPANQAVLKGENKNRHKYYLECWSVSDSLPAHFHRKSAHKWSHALRVQLALFIHVHHINLQQFTRQHATHAEVEPGSALIWTHRQHSTLGKRYCFVKISKIFGRRLYGMTVQISN